MRYVCIHWLAVKVQYTMFHWLVADFDRSGLWFTHQGDFICWVYPWVRKKPIHKFYSSSFLAFFESLDELQRTWQALHKANAERS